MRSGWKKTKMKTCTGKGSCGESKPIEQFYFNKSYGTYEAKCKSCNNAICRARHKRLYVKKYSKYRECKYCDTKILRDYSYLVFDVDTRGGFHPYCKDPKCLYLHGLKYRKHAPTRAGKKKKAIKVILKCNMEYYKSRLAKVWKELEYD